MLEKKWAKFPALFLGPTVCVYVHMDVCVSHVLCPPMRGPEVRLYLSPMKTGSFVIVTPVVQVFHDKGTRYLSFYKVQNYPDEL